MKGKDFLKQRDKEEEAFFQAVLNAKNNVERLKVAVEQHKDSLKNSEAKLKELEEMTLEKWKKK